MSLEKNSTPTTKKSKFDLSDLNLADADSSSEINGPLEGLESECSKPHDSGDDRSILDKKRIRDK